MDMQLLRLVGVEVLRLVLRVMADYRAKGGDLDRLLDAARSENERDIYDVLGIDPDRV